MNKVYTKNQIQISAFLMGPVAAIYFLKKNFELLGEEKKAKETIRIGLIALIAYALITPFIDAKPFYIGFWIGVPILLGQIFAQHQIELQNKECYSFIKVLWISIIGLISFATLLFTVMFLYITVGIVQA